MTNDPLYVVFLWHMHQPLYRDPLTGIYRLPWVRLHGTKDYLDMVRMLKDFPAITQNFNLAPSLLEQIKEYTEAGATDLFWEASRKPAAELSADEKIFLLANFFLANPETMIRPLPRYHELLAKRGPQALPVELGRTARQFAAQDFLDLQVLFNLAWIDPSFREADPLLKMLVTKGRRFTEEDKMLLLTRQKELLGEIIPEYRDAAAAGRIELSFSPYYHPILPLLCDSEIARISMPGAKLPKPFRHPEDAEAHISRGAGFFKKVFGVMPSGMWPSEGSLSEEVLRISASLGIQWVATDEEILSRSLGKRLRNDAGAVTEPDLLYRPYRFENVSMIFRDHTISDMISFVYSQWEPEKAAEDLIRRLVEIRASLRGGTPRLVAVIMDGENAWEYYRNDGRDFLLRFYELLSHEERLRPVTISRFLADHDRGESLGSVFPGSWINSDFSIWIGHEEDNLAWDYLSQTRQDLGLFQKEHPGRDLDKAWLALYAAEGSDWNWWYGDDHATDTREEFDELFRLNLIRVYREMGKDPPEVLFLPVLRQAGTAPPAQTIRGFIRPKIDGIVTSYYEWYQGAMLDVKKSGGSMHKAESLISALHYGFDKDNLFIRMDANIPFSEFQPESAVSIFFSNRAPFKISCTVSGRVECRLYGKTGEEWEQVKELREAAVRDIFELAVPFRDIRAAEKDEVNFYLTLRVDGQEVERCPWRGHITVIVPTADFDAMMWQ